MSQVHIRKFWESFPTTPDQPAVGHSPQDYLEKLNTICGLRFVWPAAYPPGKLTRPELRKLCRDTKVDVLVAYAAVMAWGGRGVDSRNYRLSLEAQSRKNLGVILEALRKSTNDRQKDFEEMKRAAANIKGLGISFYTKLLFFFRKKPDAYILDQFTAKSSSLLFDPCPVILTTSGYPDPNTTPESYESFCSNVEALAKSPQQPTVWTAEQIEQAMFDVRGGTWRKHIRSVYGKATTKRTNQPKVLPAVRKISTMAPKGITPAAAIGNDSLPALVASVHAKAYRASRELPGEQPQLGTAIPVRVHCRQIDGVDWQYAFHQTKLHAEVFIPAKHVARYNALRKYLGVTDHNFGDGIRGNGAKNGKTRSIKLTVPQGLNAPQNDWHAIADQAVDAMAILFDRVCEHL